MTFCRICLHSKMAENTVAEKEESELSGNRDGIGLAVAFKIISSASGDRLHSLIFKMGSSHAEVLVQAMSLIRLNKRQEALEKLQSLKNNKIAMCLADKVVQYQGSLEEFTMECPQLPDLQADSQTAVAGIFQVLAKEGLCSDSLQNQTCLSNLYARRSVTTSEERKGSEHFQQLITDVIGPQTDMGNSQFSCTGGETLKSCSVPLCTKSSPAIPIPGSHCSLVRANEHSSPSSLRTSSPSEMSFPSRLEVSESPTTMFNSYRINRDMQDLRLTPSHISKEDVSPSVSAPLSGVQPRNEHSEEQINKNVITNPAVAFFHASPHQAATPSYPCATETSQLVVNAEQCETNSATTSKSTDTKGNRASSLKQVTEAPLSHPTIFMGNESPKCPITEVLSDTSMPVSSNEVTKTKGEHEGEEVQFFSFVIFHAPEDWEIAENLKEKLEGLSIGEGSTFSENFLVPGKSALKCVEDAIDNSAFTILLLSRNFNTQLHEFQSNAALMNAIDNQHKFNSVIPLLPSKNRLRSKDMPRYLKIFVPLDERSSSFDKMAKKAMAPEKIKMHRERWNKEQQIRAQQEKKVLLKEEIKHSKILARETKESWELKKQLMQCNMWHQQYMQQMLRYPLPFGPDPIPAPAFSCTPMQRTPVPEQHSFNSDWQLNMNMLPGCQHPSIHIENASYIMIGNNSQMAVETCPEKSEGDDKWEN